MERSLGFAVAVGKPRGVRARSICKAEGPEDNGVSQKARRPGNADLNQQILESSEKQQDILRYMSARDRLEYIDSKGNLTRTFYNAVALTLFIYGSLVVGGFYFAKGVGIYIARLLQSFG